MKCLVVAPSPVDELVVSDTRSVYSWDGACLKKLQESPEDPINAVDVVEGHAAFSTLSKQLVVDGQAVPLPRKAGLLQFCGPDVLVALRDGALLELNTETKQFGVPEFGRSVSLTAMDGRRIGDRDGVVCAIPTQSNRIEQIWTLGGYVQQISGDVAAFEGGLYSLAEDRVLLEEPDVVSVLQDGARLFIVAKSKTVAGAYCLASVDAEGRKAELFALPVVNTKAVRSDVAPYVLKRFRKDFLIVGVLNGLVLDSAGRVQLDGSQFADVHERVVNECHVVKVHFEGKTMVYDE